jgi:phage baseplate assembly protein W
MDGSIKMTERAISMPFSIDASGGIAYSERLEKIWQDRVLLAVMTSLGERVMRPDFGGTVPASLFENPNDALSLIRQSVQVTFSRWLQPLTLLSVSGYVGDDNTLMAEIFYNLRETSQEQSVTIKTAILSRSGDIILEVPND